MRKSLFKIIDVVLVSIGVIFMIALMIKNKAYNGYFGAGFICAFVNLVSVFTKDENKK